MTSRRLYLDTMTKRKCTRKQASGRKRLMMQDQVPGARCSVVGSLSECQVSV